MEWLNESEQSNTGIQPRDNMDGCYVLCPKDYASSCVAYYCKGKKCNAYLCFLYVS